MAKGKSGNGSNFSLPKPKQTETVKQKKDSMAANIGNHMGPMAGSGGKAAKSPPKGK